MLQSSTDFIASQKGIPKIKIVGPLLDDPDVKIDFQTTSERPFETLINPISPSTLADRGLTLLMDLLSQSGMYLAEPQEHQQIPLNGSTTQNTISSATVLEKSAPKEEVLELSALAEFPIAQGQPGMVNFEGQARPRMENLIIARAASYLMQLVDAGECSLPLLCSQAPVVLWKAQSRQRLEPFIPNESLCSRCLSLNLTPEEFLPSGPYDQAIHRESSRTLAQYPFAALTINEACPLCRLIKHGLSAANTGATAIDLSQLYCNVSMQYFSVFGDNVGQMESFRLLAVSGTLPGEKRSTIRVDLVPVESRNYPMAFIGRQVRENEISLRLIRRWPEQCENIHGSRCANMDYNHIEGKDKESNSTARLTKLLQHLRFIDVQENCLTSFSQLERYLALSYVWGKAKSSHTTKANLHERLQHGSLSPAVQNLPTLIIDAMALTRGLGERYLWVDSLCIVQDDECSKNHAINEMNLVYEGALMTIVAASSHSAEEGLPGVRPDSRTVIQECATFGPDLKFIIPHNMQALDQTAWAGRAWTFQEHCFSKRKLIFLNGQVTFTCSWDAPCREDIISELQVFGMEDYVYKLPGSHSKLESIIP